jgi:sec-independent protein translocase protein TatA
LRVEEVRVFREISAWHLGIILLAFVLLFGYKKLPDATRSLGRSMRIFKSEVKGLHDDEPKQVETAEAAQPATPEVVAQPAVDTVKPQRGASPDVPRASESRVDHS